MRMETELSKSYHDNKQYFFNYLIFKIIMPLVKIKVALKEI